MQDRFAACLAELVDIEGGYSNRSRKEDPGGATMFGVTWQTYNAYRDFKGLPRRDVRQIDHQEIIEIYRNFFWRRAHADELPVGLDLAVFDFAVNSGPATAIKYLQRALGIMADGHYGAVTAAAIKSSYLPQLIAAYVEERRRFGRGLSNYWANKGGWENRWNRIECSAQQACGAHDWADVRVEPAPANLEERSEEQSRAYAEPPMPPRATELMLGG